MSKQTRFTAAVLALTLLAGSAAHALPRSGRTAPAPVKPAGLLSPLWSWLYDFFLPAGPLGSNRLTAAWGEEGGIMDPDGNPADAGGMMDPNGSPKIVLDEGPIMDPNG